MNLDKAKFSLDRQSDRPLLITLAAGITLGLAAGYLFATQSGKEFRKKAADVLRDQGDNLAHQFEKAKEAVGNAKDEIARTTDRVADRVKDKADTYANRAHNEAKDLADDAKSGVNKFNSELKLN